MYRGSGQNATAEKCGLVLRHAPLLARSREGALLAKGGQRQRSSGLCATAVLCTEAAARTPLRWRTGGGHVIVGGITSRAPEDDQHCG